MEKTCLMHFVLWPISCRIREPFGTTLPTPKTLSSEVAVMIARLESNTYWLTFQLYLWLSKNKNYESISPMILLWGCSFWGGWVWVPFNKEGNRILDTHLISNLCWMNPLRIAWLLWWRRTSTWAGDNTSLWCYFSWFHLGILCQEPEWKMELHINQMDIR